MKNTAGTFILILLSLTFIYGQDRETRSLDQFEAVHVATGINATLQAGQENSVKYLQKALI